MCLAPCLHFPVTLAMGAKRSSLALCTRRYSPSRRHMKISARHKQDTSQQLTSAEDRPKVGSFDLAGPELSDTLPGCAAVLILELLKYANIERQSRRTFVVRTSTCERTFEGSSDWRINSSRGRHSFAPSVRRRRCETSKVLSRVLSCALRDSKLRGDPTVLHSGQGICDSRNTGPLQRQHEAYRTVNAADFVARSVIRRRRPPLTRVAIGASDTIELTMVQILAGEVDVNLVVHSSLFPTASGT